MSGADETYVEDKNLLQIRQRPPSPSSEDNLQEASHAASLRPAATQEDLIGTRTQASTYDLMTPEFRGEVPPLIPIEGEESTGSGGHFAADRIKDLTGSQNSDQQAESAQHLKATNSPRTADCSTHESRRRSLSRRSHSSSQGIAHSSRLVSNKEERQR